MAIDALAEFRSELEKRLRTECPESGAVSTQLAIVQWLLNTRSCLVIACTATDLKPARIELQKSGGRDENPRVLIRLNLPNDVHHNYPSAIYAKFFDVLMEIAVARFRTPLLVIKPDEKVSIVKKKIEDMVNAAILAIRHDYEEVLSRTIPTVPPPPPTHPKKKPSVDDEKIKETESVLAGVSDLHKIIVIRGFRG